MHYRENSVQIFFFRAGFIISFNSLVFCADSAPVPAQVSDTLPDILSAAHNTPDEKMTAGAVLIELPKWG